MNPFLLEKFPINFAPMGKDGVRQSRTGSQFSSFSCFWPFHEIPRQRRGRGMHSRIYESPSSPFQSSLFILRSFFVFCRLSSFFFSFLSFHNPVIHTSRP